MRWNSIPFFFSPLLCVVASGLMSTIWIHALSVPANHADVYSTAVVAYAVCACIESLAEPMWIVAQQLHMDKFIVSH